VIDWTESAPRATGADPGRLAHAVDLVRARGGAAQLCVLHRGHVVLDRAYRCAPDALFWIFSTSKPFTALLVHRLAQDGRLALDDPVAAHWPEFAARGKRAITIRHVLQHRSGVPFARNPALDMLAMANWERTARALEAARPTHPPGRTPAYHVITYGAILGELVRRITNQQLPDVLRTTFLEPLGLTDTALGLRPGHWPRHVPVRGGDPPACATALAVNTRTLREAAIPSAGISTTARDLARFYRALLAGGELDGVRILTADTLTAAREPSTANDEIDKVIRLPIRWSHAFQLGGPVPAPHPSRPMGRTSSPLTFGHNGSNCCIAWADPTRDLAFAYLTDRLESGHRGARHLSDVADAVLSACP
jgi:CubicO group peptidase (beta-lactamase class C family)